MEYINRYAKPNDFNIPKTIDDLFGAYQQIKAQEDQRNRQDFADTVQYGTPIRGLTPDQLQRGAAGPTQPPAPQMPPGMAGPPAPAPAPQFDSDPHVAAIQQFIQRKRQMDQMGLQKEALGMDLTRSEIAKNLGAAGDQFYSHDQAASLMSPSQNPDDIAKTRDSLARLYPSGRVPKDFTHVAATNNRMELTTGVRQDQFDAKQWQAINHDANPDVAGPRKLVGMAGALNKRVAAGLKNTEGNPTNQQLNGAIADVATMLTNGAADDMAIKAQSYNTIQGKLNDLKTLVTSRPTEAAPPEVVAKVRKTLQEMAGINNDVISRNLKTTETIYGDTINRNDVNRRRFDNFKADVERSIIPVTDNPNISDGSVRMQTPDGKVWNIPANKVDAAVSRGAKRL